MSHTHQEKGPAMKANTLCNARTAQHLIGFSVCVFIIGSSLAAAPGDAATITVTGGRDGSLGKLAENGLCELREAIEASNTDSAVDACRAGSGMDTIEFDIGEGGETTILITSELPEITDPVFIDGWSQPGWGCYFSPCVEISGTHAGTANGLVISAGDSRVRALSITRFRLNGIHVTTGGHNRIDDCYIGTNSAGTPNMGNLGHGILIESSHNQVGGGHGYPYPSLANTIADNGEAGIAVVGSYSIANALMNNSIFGNGGPAIDLNADGVTPNDDYDADSGPNHLRNHPVITRVDHDVDRLEIDGKLHSHPESKYRVQIFSIEQSEPGGGKDLVGDFMACTDHLGDAYFSFVVDKHVPRGQVFAATATDEHGNTSEFSAPARPIDTIGEPNVITVNGLDDAWPTSELAGNGTCDLREAFEAVDENEPRGECPAGSALDLIAFNVGGGGEHVFQLIRPLPWLHEPVIIDGTTQPDCPDGPCVDLNSSLHLYGGSSTIRGLKFYSEQPCIEVRTRGKNIIEGNVFVRCSAAVILQSEGNLIGGTTPGTANVITQSTGPGIMDESSRNRIVGNAIFDNSGLGIDRIMGNYIYGVTPNDYLDKAMPQNFPVITSVVEEEDRLRIAGRLGSLPDTEFRIDFYVNRIAHVSGHGEGRLHVGETKVLTNEFGEAEFVVSIPGQFLTSNYLTATAARPDGSTSEFSKAFELRTLPPPIITVTGLADGPSGELDGNGTCDLREAIIAANSDSQVGECPAGRGADLIAFDIGGGGAQVIDVTSALPIVVHPLTLDGLTQPGCMEGPCVEIRDPDGQFDGLVIAGGNSVVRGLAINGFKTALRLHDQGNNVIQGNHIGTDLSATHALGSETGIAIYSQGNTIGGIEQGAGNTIVGSSSSAVAVHFPAWENRIVGNSIHDNSGLGIDLVRVTTAQGVTPNDHLDNDTGGNRFQNFPEMSFAVRQDDRLAIGGRLSSTPDSVFEIDLYVNRNMNSCGHGGGEMYLGQIAVSTDHLGNAEFQSLFPIRLSSTLYVTATATDADGNTSEFSAAMMITDPPDLQKIRRKPGKPKRRLGEYREGVSEVPGLKARHEE